MKILGSEFYLRRIVLKNDTKANCLNKARTSGQG